MSYILNYIIYVPSDITYNKLKMTNKTTITIIRKSNNLIEMYV